MNQRDEQRVIDALGALTGGLIVTEQEILDAGGRLRSSLEPPSPGHRPALIVATAAAVAAIIGLVLFQAVGRDDDAAPQPAPAPPSAAEELAADLQADAYTGDDFTAGARPTAEDLAGFWLLRSPHGQNVLLVDGDGDWTHGLQDSFATSTLVGDTWTRHLDTAIFRDCQTNNLPWTAAIAGDGSMHLELSGRVGDCTPAGSREVWDRLVPGPSPVMDYLRETSSDIDWAAATDSDLSGLYINRETGHVLDVAENGSYSYLDSLTGQEISPSDRGALEGTAGELAGSCQNGNFSATFEVGTTPAAPGYVMAYDAMKITGSEGTCTAGVGTDGVWIKLY